MTMQADQNHKATQYLKELDGIRALSIFLILATHMLPVGLPAWRLNAMTGPMGMSLFFCLSGFLITRFLWEKPGISMFLKRRFARIYPLLFVYGFIVAVVLDANWGAFAGILFIFRNYADSLVVPYSAHLWSLCLELQFYILIALAVFLGGRRAFWLIPVSCLVVLYLRIDNGAYVNIRTHLRIDEILVGSLLALAWLNPDARLSRLMIAVMSRSFWIVLPLWIASSHPATGALNYVRPYLAMLLIGSVLFAPENAIKRLLRATSLSYVAAISYALYVWHPLSMYGWLGEGGTLERYLLKRPISIFATFFVAHVSTFAFERYFTEKAKNRAFRFDLFSIIRTIPWLWFLTNRKRAGALNNRADQ